MARYIFDASYPGLITLRIDMQELEVLRKDIEAARAGFARMKRAGVEKAQASILRDLKDATPRSQEKALWNGRPRIRLRAGWRVDKTLSDRVTFGNIAPHYRVVAFGSGQHAEFGAHLIKPKHKKQMTFTYQGRKFRLKSSRGQPGQFDRWIRDISEDRASDAMEKEIHLQLRKQLRA